MRIPSKVLHDSPGYHESASNYSNTGIPKSKQSPFIGSKKGNNSQLKSDMYTSHNSSVIVESNGKRPVDLYDLGPASSHRPEKYALD
jgi:hypothetical protein